MKGGGGISRALYVAAAGRRVVVVRAFIKKTQKTPAWEIESAALGLVARALTRSRRYTAPLFSVQS
jgi:phage-related protein